MPSAPFAARELNGEMLLQEVATLRERGVPQASLEFCAAALAQTLPEGAALVPATVRAIVAATPRCPAPLGHLLAASGPTGSDRRRRLRAGGPFLPARPGGGVVAGAGERFGWGQAVSPSTRRHRLFTELSADAVARLDTWSARRRKAFAELLEDARTSLQREMLGRSLSAGRSLAELHAFADEIRRLDDDALYRACTLSKESGLEDSIVAQLRAEADPLYAYGANGHALDPAEEEVSRPSLRLPAALFRRVEAPPVEPPRTRAFDAMSAPNRAVRSMARELGSSADGDPAAYRMGGRSAVDLINAAARGWGVTFRELRIGDMRQALEAARATLELGMPVPVALGMGPGDALRYGLLLQAKPAGASWAFQLHDPIADETVWTHEGDLLGGVDLRLSNKRLRRITAVVLPNL